MANNSIKLKNYSDHIEEYVAAGTITPGMLVERDSDGEVQAHSTAAGNALPMFALEDSLQGNDIDTDYSADDPVQVWVPLRGDQVYAILADGNSVTAGDWLESDGNGYLQSHEADSGSSAILPLAIVAQALETLDLSDSSGAESSGALGYNKRIKVAII